MEDMYLKAKNGLNSLDPQALVQSAAWIIENSQQVQDQNDYMKACEILYMASVEDIECLKYIDQNLKNNPMFKAQLFSQVLRESTEQEIKDAARATLESMLEMLTNWKNYSTEIVAQIYSYLEETGDPVIKEKAKKLL
ncbi:MAG: hypothetical protein HUU50_16160 [Candidatus Brocadiae bacterium]|nr:hypothetical protein [Candidatus Brocadiia bacterium]